MKEMFGSPGKLSGLALRIGQFSFAAASVGTMISTPGFFNSTAFCYKKRIGDSDKMSQTVIVRGQPKMERQFKSTFPLPKLSCYLIASMGLQVLWSFGLACLDLHALRSKRSLYNPVLVSLFVVGDWVTAILSLAAACSSAGVTILYSKDLDYCNLPPHLPCNRFQISVALAFISWFLLAVSSLVMFWLLGTV